MSLGQSLKDIRVNKRKKQSEVCSKLKISQTYLSQIENNIKEPSSPMFRRICKYYKVPAAIVLWMATTEKDIDKSKLALWKAVKPSVDIIIKPFLN